MPPCTRTGCAGRGSMCEPHLEPGPASLRHPAARRHCRLGGAWRSAPGGAGGLAQGWAWAEHGRAARPAAARHAALPRLNWPRPRRVGTALPPPPPSRPGSAPGNVRRSALLSSLQGLNSTFSSFRLWLLLPSGGSLLPVRLLLCLPLSALSR